MVLARQLINLEAPPHPFVQAGNREFNAVVWIPSADKRAGDILIADLTLWTLYFGGTGLPPAPVGLRRSHKLPSGIWPGPRVLQFR